MSRIEDIAPESLTPAQKTVFDQLVAGRGKILGPYRVWIHSPEVAARMQATRESPRLPGPRLPDAIRVVAELPAAPLTLAVVPLQHMGGVLARQPGGGPIAGLTELSRSVAEIANLAPNDWQPYVGRSAFAHKGGVHGAAVAKVRS